MENFLTNEMVERKNAILADTASIEKIKEDWTTYRPVVRALEQKTAKELLEMAGKETDPIRKVLCALAMTEAEPVKEKELV